MKYTYEELQIMLDETEKAFDVMRKFAEVTNEFLMREDVKPLYQKFLIEKVSKQNNNIADHIGYTVEKVRKYELYL